MAFGYFYDMPIGRMFIAEDGLGISEVQLISGQDENYYLKNYTIEETNLIKEAALQLKEYFEGKRKAFDIKLIRTAPNFRRRSGMPCCRFRTGKPEAIRK